MQTLFFKKKLLFFSAIVIGSLGSLAAVLGGIGASNISTKNADVAVLLSSLNNPYFEAVSSGIRDEAKTLNISLQFYDSNNSIEKEDEHVANIIATGKKVVLFNDVNEQSGVNAVKKFTQAGVKVIAVDHILVFDQLAKKKEYQINSSNFEVVANIASDNFQAGKILALYVRDILKIPFSNARTFSLYGIPGTESGMSRAAGFSDVLDPSKPNDKYKLSVYSDSAGDANLQNVGFQANDNRDQAYNITTNNLINFTKNATNFKNIIFGTNDEAALGAIQALKNSNNSDLLYGNHPWTSTTDKNKVYVLGIDNTKDALNAISQGEMSATVEQDTHLMGSLGVSIAKFFLDDMLKNNLNTLSEIKAWQNVSGNQWSYFLTKFDFWYKNLYSQTINEKTTKFSFDEDPNANMKNNYFFKLFTSLTYADPDTNSLLKADYANNKLDDAKPYKQ